MVSGDGMNDAGENLARIIRLHKLIRKYRTN
jgi:hypothetical protein